MSCMRRLSREAQRSQEFRAATAVYFCLEIRLLASSTSPKTPSASQDLPTCHHTRHARGIIFLTHSGCPLTACSMPRHLKKGCHTATRPPHTGYRPQSHRGTSPPQQKSTIKSSPVGLASLILDQLLGLLQNHLQEDDQANREQPTSSLPAVDTHQAQVPHHFIKAYKHSWHWRLLPDQTQLLAFLP